MFIEYCISIHFLRTKFDVRVLYVYTKLIVNYY